MNEVCHSQEQFTKRTGKRKRVMEESIRVTHTGARHSCYPVCYIYMERSLHCSGHTYIL